MPGTSLERIAQVPLPPSVFSHNSSEIEQEEYELGDLQSIGSLSIGAFSQHNVSELALTDGGIKAWSFVSAASSEITRGPHYLKLAAAFIVEAVVWAFPSSFGVLLNAYMQEAKLTSQANASELLPLIGTFSSGFMQCSGRLIPDPRLLITSLTDKIIVAPFINPFLNRYARLRRISIYVGLAICCASLFSASYATKAS